MSTTNSNDSLLTKSAVWTVLCEAAHAQAIDTGLEGERWEAISEQIDGAESAMLVQLFRPLLGPLPENRPLVVGHLAQSLDGCIAQANGESHWISGEGDLDHTHRLRALCDVVLVGAETVARDDCQLSVRRVDGPNPIRVVLDPRARLSGDRKVFQADGGRTLWVIGSDCAVPPTPHRQVEVIQLSAQAGQFDLCSLLGLLHGRGLRRLFVEGGGITVSRFLRAGLMDRLHIAVAPILIGGGRPTIGHALGESLADCPRPAVQIHAMGLDWLFDCDFSMTVK